MAQTLDGLPEEQQEREAELPNQDPGYHSADTDADHRISLNELMRVVQLFNAGAYSCADPPQSTEDGYLPGTGDESCAPHNSDYAPQDWSIGLSELLRLIQLFNAGVYMADAEGEDGFIIDEYSTPPIYPLIGLMPPPTEPSTCGCVPKCGSYSKVVNREWLSSVKRARLWGKEIIYVDCRKTLPCYIPYDVCSLSFPEKFPIAGYSTLKNSTLPFMLPPGFSFSEEPNNIFLLAGGKMNVHVEAGSFGNCYLILCQTSTQFAGPEYTQNFYRDHYKWVCYKPKEPEQTTCVFTSLSKCAQTDFSKDEVLVYLSEPARLYGACPEQ
jgi:hypothetical protein